MQLLSSGGEKARLEVQQIFVADRLTVPWSWAVLWPPTRPGLAPEWRMAFIVFHGATVVILPEKKGGK